MAAVPLSQRIRAARIERGWSQAELARRIGKKRHLVISWERDRHAPSEESARLLAGVFGGDVTDWMPLPSLTLAQQAAQVPEMLKRLEAAEEQDRELRDRIQALEAQLRDPGGHSPGGSVLRLPAEPDS